MTRPFTAAALAALQADVVHPIVLLEGEFDGGTVRLWTGTGDLQWNSETWAGGHTLIGVSGLTDTSDVIAEGITVSFSGVMPSLVSAAIEDSRQGLPGRIWIGFLDVDGNLIVDPYKAFVGTLNVPNIVDSSDACSITLAYDSQLIELLRPRNIRYTHEAQQVLFPGDLGLEYVTTSQDFNEIWGSS